MKRYAIVRGHKLTAEQVAAYLPNNYHVLWTGKCDWHLDGRGNTWKQFPVLNDTVVVMQGEDDHGWSLDRYIAPRLGSGLMGCDEIDLSHPIMKEIPA